MNVRCARLGAKLPRLYVRVIPNLTECVSTFLTKLRCMCDAYFAVHDDIGTFGADLIPPARFSADSTST